MQEYKKQLEKGVINQAYKGLMEYILELKAYFKNKYPDYFVSGSLYSGYMDMTYFSFFPGSLKQRNLKIAVVFIHESCRFEAWLAGYNKQVQQKYWELIKASGWNKYRLVSTTKGADSIIEHTLVADPDFGDLEALTGQIETATLEFIKDIENFLSEH
jgi:hypothetical protein